LKKQRKNPKYTNYDSKRKVYRIRRQIKGKVIHFGNYKTREEVERAIEIFEEIGWDPVKNWAVKAKVRDEMLGRKK